MNTDQLDQDPFRDPNIPSLAQALENFAARPDETPSRKMRARGAVAMFGRLRGKRPDKIPAQPNFVIHEFARLRTRPTNLHPKSIANCKAEIRYLLEKCGTATGRSRFRPLSPDWAALREQLTHKEGSDEKFKSKALFWKISRFAAFCSAKGVPPSAVTDAVLNEFRDALQASAEVIRPEAKVREAIRAWNTIAGNSSPALPTLFLAPTVVRRWTIAPADFPQEFQNDVEQWSIEMREVDPDAEEGRTRALRPDIDGAPLRLLLILFGHGASAFSRRPKNRGPFHFVPV
ncbi:MAG TPA: hypothetical protein VHX39_24555, partial [Acetobacteraceae bacterium]|nr:hypothetical protein [Acetobacteraceae bacterium]